MLRSSVFIELCDLYGFDIVVIPTRSFDKDPCDCGLFSRLKQFGRGRQRRPTTAKGLWRLWKLAAKACISDRLIRHCFRRAGYDV